MRYEMIHYERLNCSWLTSRTHNNPSFIAPFACLLGRPICVCDTPHTITTRIIILRFRAQRFSIGVTYSSRNSLVHMVPPVLVANLYRPKPRSAVGNARPRARVMSQISIGPYKGWAYKGLHKGPYSGP